MTLFSYISNISYLWSFSILSQIATISTSKACFIISTCLSFCLSITLKNAAIATIFPMSISPKIFISLSALLKYSLYKSYVLFTASKDPFWAILQAIKAILGLFCEIFKIFSLYAESIFLKFLEMISLTEILSIDCISITEQLMLLGTFSIMSLA